MSVGLSLKLGRGACRWDWGFHLQTPAMLHLRVLSVCLSSPRAGRLEVLGSLLSSLSPPSTTSQPVTERSWWLKITATSPTWLGQFLCPVSQNSTGWIPSPTGVICIKMHPTLISSLPFLALLLYYHWWQDSVTCQLKYWLKFFRFTAVAEWCNTTNDTQPTCRRNIQGPALLGITSFFWYFPLSLFSWVKHIFLSTWEKLQTLKKTQKINVSVVLFCKRNICLWLKN